MQRRNTVRTLERYSIDIQAGPSVRTRIWRSLEVEAKALHFMCSMPTFTYGPNLERCVPRRIRRILPAFRKVKRMLEQELYWEASAMLALISKHVGRLRLMGVEDHFADLMDSEARELHVRYAWKRSDNPAIFHCLHSMSVLMSYVDACCGCHYCRG